MFLFQGPHRLFRLTAGRMFAVWHDAGPRIDGPCLPAQRAGALLPNAVTEFRHGDHPFLSPHQPDQRHEHLQKRQVIIYGQQAVPHGPIKINDTAFTGQGLQKPAQSGHG